MTAYFLGLLMFLAYGVFCLLAPEKHLAFNAWWSLRRRREWHKHRAGLRMERRQSQQTPANLWRMRANGIAFIAMSLWAIWWCWRMIHR